MNSTRPAILSLLFATLFIVSQGVLLAHESNLNEHVDGDNCEICFQFGQLGSALPGGEITLDFPPQQQQATSLHAHAFFTRPAHLSPPSRAPPFFI